MASDSTSARPLPPPPPAKGGGEEFGRLPTGEPVYAHTLTNSHGLSLTVINYGAIVTQLHVPDRNGKLADIVCGFNSLEQYLAGHPYFGCIAGRVAGRITKGRFTLDGVTYQLAINDPPNHLHGGEIGFDKRLWTIDSANSAAIHLSLISESGDQGYPGRVQVRAVFRLTEANDFRIEYEATTDAPTPFSVTHHGYFNLAGEGSGSIEDHLLQIEADEYATSDAAMGLLTRAAVTPANDFRKPRRLGDAIDGLWQRHGDLYFINGGRLQTGGVFEGNNAVLTHPPSGRTMTIHTSEPCLQLYTGMGLDGSLVGKSGRPYRQFGAVCLEAERYPDGVNEPALGDIILRPGQTYRQIIDHSFSTKPSP